MSEVNSRRKSIIDGGKRLVVERAPWLLGYLPSIAGRGFSLEVTRDRLILSDRSRRQIWLNRANAVYLPDLAASFEYYFSAVEHFVLPASVGGGRVVDYSSPRYHQVQGFQDFPVMFPSLAEPFQTCEQYLEFAQLREGQTAMDLGCYAGLTAIAFSKSVGITGSVIAVEPDPSNRAIASKNLALHHRVNGLDNVKLLPYAIGGEEGTVEFSAEGSMGSASVRIVGGYRGAIVEVPTLTLDGILLRAGAPKVDFIKMDIEGAELEVIRSARSFLTSHRPRMIIEPHEVDGRLVTQELVVLLRSFGYRCGVIEQFGVSLPLVTALPEERPG
jgi:FkbM family methyltransferase